MDIAHGDHASAPAAISTGWTAFGDEFLPAEADYSVSAVSCSDPNFGIIYKQTLPLLSM